MPSNTIPEPAPKLQAAYRLLHTADWHLGKMLGEKSRDEEHRLFLDWLHTCIATHQVDAILIAGDVYDFARPPQTAARMYFDFLATLFRDSDCEVVVTAGNHDSPANLDAPREALKALQVHVVGEMPAETGQVLIPLPTGGPTRLVIAAIPFLRDRDLRTGRLGQSSMDIQAELREGIARRYAEAAEAFNLSAIPNAACIAAGHLTTTGATTSDSEREIHIGGLGDVGGDAFPELFQYVALGHLHRPQSSGPAGRICYSGSPLPLSFSEADDRKSVRLLDFVDGRIEQNQILAVPVFRQLVRIRTTRDELEPVLKNLKIPSGELATWVELTIETDHLSAGSELYELVRELTAGKPFEVIKLSVESRHGVAALGADASMEIGNLLDNPANVFDQLLLQQTDCDDEQLVALRTAFAELCDMERLESGEDESGFGDGRPSAEVTGELVSPGKPGDGGS